MSSITNISDVSVVVLGGFVMDTLVRVTSLARWGEAVQAENLELVHGGKGLNQATAARQLGADVAVIGAVGPDSSGGEITQFLTSRGINTVGLEVSPHAATPITIVFSNSTGGTAFVGWKNERRVSIDAAQVIRHESLIANADVLLMTLEVDSGAITQAIQLARQSDTLTVLNPAPPLDRRYQPSDLELKDVDFLIPHEWEARQLPAIYDQDISDIHRLTRVLCQKTRAKNVIVTRAHYGCTTLINGQYCEYPAYRTNVVDTTGASDAFCAALAVYSRAGHDTGEAINHAQAAGAWAVTRAGAARHVPDQGDLERRRIYLDGTNRG